MPTSQPASDNAKPRLRGDMYLRAEQRKREEAAAAELTGILTPPEPPVYDATSVEAVVAPSAATASPAVAIGAITTIAPLPVSGVVKAAPDVHVESTDAPAPEPVRRDSRSSPAMANPAVVAQDPRSDPAVADRPAAAIATDLPAAEPVKARPAAKIARNRERTRRALIPATALVTMATIAAAFGIAGILWPPGKAEAPTLVSPKTVAAAGPAAPRPAFTPVDTVRDADAPPRDTAPAPQAVVPQGTAYVSSTSVAPTPGRSDREDQARQDPPRPAEVRVSNVTRTDAAAAATGRASEGQLRVTSSPSGARVTVNGIGWGQTPVTIGHLPLGTKIVRVTHDGYATQQRVVDLRSDSAVASLSVALPRAH